jgi:glutamyl-tRNA reductase
MHESLVIYHSTSGQLTNPLFDSDKWLRWNTCVRQVAIGFEDSIGAEGEIFLGPEAYGFFLEVISGLHSPIVGETEVMGQFKELIEKANQSDFKNKAPLLNFFRNALKDAKTVRSSALKDMGSRSYGSLLRKYLKESRHVTILGAGKLVGEILPWLKPMSAVTIKCRRLEQGQQLKEKYNFINVESWSSEILGDTLLIAAPVSKSEISKLFVGISGLERIIDLRENSSRDSLKLGIPTVTLDQLFSEIENTEKDVEQKVLKARALIKDLSQKWTLKAEHRPFGWEDLCG